MNLHCVVNEKILKWKKRLKVSHLTAEIKTHSDEEKRTQKVGKIRLRNQSFMKQCRLIEIQLKTFYPFANKISVSLIVCGFE